MKHKSTKLGKMPRSVFHCLECGTGWTVDEPSAGQHRCPTCGPTTVYFTWVNFNVVLTWLMKYDAEYRRSYAIGR